MNENELHEVEIDLVLETLYRRYGYDFREYARSAIDRSIDAHVIRSDVQSPSELIPKLIHSRDLFERLVRDLSVTVSTMFRDPPTFECLRRDVFPWLETHPFFRIWHVGCATGEEVYALAILLKEARLYDRATIFATDFNDEALEFAMRGIYNIENAKEYTSNYLNAGGCRSFSEYYHSHGNYIHIDRSLGKNITFANHNLVVDEVFTESHLILCRNVMIYFDSTLRERSLRLFNESLSTGGFLCLGRGELLIDAPKNGFSPFNSSHAIYRKSDSTSRQYPDISTDSKPISS